MKEYSLKVTGREQVGRGSSRRLRRSGRIPAILYGPSGTKSLSLERTEFLDLWKEVKGSSTLIQLVEEGAEEVRTLIQDYQRNPITDQFEHLDFKEILAGVEMQTQVGIHIVGESIGVKNEQALLDTHNHEVGVRCLPRDLPRFIEVDVTELHAGDSIHVRDLTPIENVVFTDDPDRPIVACVLPSLADEEEEAAEEEVAEGEEAAEGEEEKTEEAES